MTNLVTLSGQPRPFNETLININPRELSNTQAGLVFFKIVAEAYPGITWGQWAEMAKNYKGNKRLSGAWENFKGGVGDIYDGVAGVSKDVISGVGDIGGSTIRLLTDEEVAGTVMRAGSAYATGGGSEGLLAMFGQGGIDLFGKAGETYKSTGLPVWTMYAGLGLVGFGLIYMAVK